MNSPVLQSGQPVLIPVSVDRVRMIRRSMRCFVFGIFGAIPFFGLGLAWVALKSQRQLSRETGDNIPIRLPCLMSIACLELMIMFLRLDLEFLALVSAVLSLGVPLVLIQRQYRRFEPAEWNPARHLAYWGVGLACAGIVLSCIGVVVVCVLAVGE